MLEKTTTSSSNLGSGVLAFSNRTSEVVAVAEKATVDVAVLKEASPARPQG